jgi:hypothetical protein
VINLTAAIPAAGIDLDVLDGVLQLDEQWSPFIQASLTVHVQDPSHLSYLEPRARSRVIVTASDGTTSRRFDLLLRGRSMDWATGQVTITLDCDEALLHDAALVQAGDWRPLTGSVRDITAHVLASIGAELQPGTDDGLVDDPAETAWTPGQTGIDYLTPILQAAGLRLYCDEARRWWLVDADSPATGFVALDAGTNITGVTDAFDLDSDDSYFDAVVIGYEWTDTAGDQQRAWDVAGTPSGLYDISAANSAPLKVNLNLSRNAVLQCAVQLPQTGEWYVTQAVHGSNDATTPYESTVINRLTPAGDYIDSMTLVDGGHGTQIGVEWSGGAAYIWTAFARPGTAGTAHDLLRIRYARGSFERTELANTTVMPKFTTARVLTSFDWLSDWVVFRTATDTSETYTRRRISEVKANVNRTYGSFTRDIAPPTMQGYAPVGDAMLEYTGGVNEPAGDAALLWEYAWPSGQVVDVQPTGKLGRNPDTSYPGNRHEPESVSLYRDVNSGQPYADLGVTVNESGSYDWRVYRLKLTDSYNAQATRVLSLSYPVKRPAAGAAARVLARRQAFASSIQVQAIADLTVNPAQPCTVQLPAAAILNGAVSSVAFRFPDREMELRTRDLTTADKWAWLSTDAELAWTDIRTGVPWTGFDPAVGGAGANAWVIRFPAGTSWLEAQPAGVSWNRLGLAPLGTWAGAPTGATWTAAPAGVAWNEL